MQLEGILLHHPAVHEVAVVAESDEKWGERPLALVHLKPEYVNEINEAKLRKHVARHADKGGLSRFALLVNIVFVEGLLKTSVGKTNKKEMRHQLSNFRKDSTSKLPLKFSEN